MPIDPSKVKLNVPSLFADEVNIARSVKYAVDEKDKNKIVRADGYVELVFLKIGADEPLTIARVVVSPTTARQLGEILSKEANKLFEIMDLKTIEEVKKAGEELKKSSTTAREQGMYR